MTARPRSWFRRRRVGAAAVGVVAALTLAACGGQAGSAGGQASKSFSVLIDGMPSTFDQFNTVAAPWGAILMVDEPLIRYDGSRFQPDLASSFKVVSPTEYTYTLRSGIKFTDGTPLTAEDVKYTLEQSMDQTHYSTTWTVTSSIKDIAVSGNDITVTLKAPQPQFQYVVAQTGIVSKAFYEKNGSKVGTPGVGLVGTGPYELKSFDPKKSAVLVPNPGYWGEKARFDQITFTTAADDSARMLSLQSGEANAIFEVPIAQVDAVGKIPGFSITEVPDSTLYILEFDVTKKPFDDPLVREAIRHAIDREGLVQAAFGGKADVAQTFTRATTLEKVADKATVESTLAGFDQQNDYDLTEAKQLMAASSVPQGFKVTLPIEPVDQNVNLIAQTIVQDLAKIGIDVTLQPEADDYFTKVLQGHQDEGLTLNAFQTNTPDPAMPLGYFVPKSGLFNMTQQDVPAAEKALEQSNTLPVDDPKRGSLLLRVLEAEQDSGTILPLAMPDMYFGLKAPFKAQGFSNYWWMSRWDVKVTAQ